MKRQKPRNKTGNKRKAEGSPGNGRSRPAHSRRAILKRASNSALVVIPVGGLGWYLVQDVMAGIREQDLSRIGNGTPSVVQIHDPQCQLCVALQREARTAMAEFNDGELQFLVANIRSEDGRKLAAAHGVGHVTLLLFDAAGGRRNVLVGSNTSEYLEAAFRRHIARSGAS